MVALRKIDIIEETDSSLGAANDNVPFPPHHRNIRMSAVSHGGLYVQNGRRSRGGSLLTILCPLDTGFGNGADTALRAASAANRSKYDGNGRVTDHIDNRDGNQSRIYGYDGAGRLTSATGPWGVGAGGVPASVTASYSYDGLGNILTKSMDQRMVTLNYDSQTNRLLSSNDNGNWWGDPTGQNTGLRNFTYDSRGNVTGIATVGGGTMSFTYDMSDQPVAVGGSKDGQSLDETYVYDGNLKRVKAVTGGEIIYSVYASGALIHTDNRSTGVATDYIAGPLGQAARVKRTNGLPGTDDVTFLHNDHLGSSTSATNKDKIELWTESYTPYGESLVNNAANDNQPGFTGHIKDKATGLNYMQARYFDPVGARFLSVDPVTFMGSGNDPRYFNRYMYSANDPVNYVDANGECFGPVAAACGAIAAAAAVGAGVGVAVEGVVIAVEGGNPFDVGANKGRYAVAGTIGAVSGGVGGAAVKEAVQLGLKVTASTTSKVTTGAIAGSAAGATAEASSQFAETGSVSDLGAVGKSAALGGLTGGIAGGAQGQIQKAGSQVGSAAYSTGKTINPMGLSAPPSSNSGATLGAAAGTGVNVIGSAAQEIAACKSEENGC